MNAPDGYLEPAIIQQLLNAAHIPVVKEKVVTTKEELLISCQQKQVILLLLKVVGPVHKSDVGGVTLNIKSIKHLEAEFNRMMQIKGCKGSSCAADAFRN